MVAPRNSRGLSPSDRDTYDPVLDKLVTDATFDCDWPELRERLRSALIASLPLFQSLGPPPSSIRFTTPARASASISATPTSAPGSSSILQPSSSSPTDNKTIPDSVLLSPSQRPIELEPEIGPVAPPNTDPEAPSSSSSSTSSNPQDLMLTDEAADLDPALRPSTPGGLVIPPFPPLDPHRRKRRSESPASVGAGSSGGPGGSPRVNGAQQGPMGPRAHPIDDEYDEEVVIGGRKLQGWMDEEEAKREVEKVAAKIDELTYPPFTLQRLAELVLTPTLTHTSIGKFLRAVDKALGVTTPFQPPSYTYVPPSALAPRGPLGGLGGTLSSAPARRTRSRSGSLLSDKGEYDEIDIDDADDDDINSTVPPGSTTPMFSPIPFLPVHEEGNGLLLDAAPRGLDEGLMSPLMLGDEGANGTFFDAPGVGAGSGGEEAEGPGAGGRSPTPEPDDVEMASESGDGARAGISEDSEEKGQGTSSASAGLGLVAGAGADTSRDRASNEDSSDPAHQPYLGRVDELDAGPITAPPALNGHSRTRSGGNGAAHGAGIGAGSRDAGSEAEAVAGTGETGTLTPHGMNERPVALSATTVIGDEGRAIAPIPRTRAGASEEGEATREEGGEGKVEKE